MNRAWLAVAWFLLSFSGWARAEVVFSHTCKVYEEPNPNSRVRCVQKAGTAVGYAKNAGDSFFSVETKRCAGYVANRCLSNGEVRRAPKSFGDNFQGEFFLGISPELDLNWASVPYSSGHSSGIGYGFQLSAMYQFSHSFRLAVQPTFVVYKLSRTLNGSISIVDPNPPSISQSVTYGGLGVQGSLALSDAQASSILWWLNGELQYLIPLSGSQTDNFTGSSITQSSKPSGNPFLFSAGITGEYPLTPRYFLGVGLQGFVNLAGSGGSRLFGVRTLLDFHFAL